MNEALDFAHSSGETNWLAELQRFRGELLLIRGEESAAEASFREAIAIAQRQEAMSWELRAALDLARLWQKQGEAQRGHALVADIYGRFAEGFDTPDLREAKALLDVLAP